MAFCYNWTNFYTYLLNLQGDVVAILDDDFNVVVEYTYSAYGEILSITGPLASTIGQINPLRYRGYYYDVETGFYYLNSRYYDPVVGRFLNADAYLFVDEYIFGTNMFSYCNNNPINNVDPLGTWTIGLSINANVAAFLGASIAIGVFVDDNGNWDLQWSYSAPGTKAMSVGLLGAGVGVSLQGTGADTVYDLYGVSSTVGASAGHGYYLGADIISFAELSDLNAGVDGFQITAGYGVGIDAHVSNVMTHSVFSSSEPASNNYKPYSIITDYWRYVPMLNVMLSK